MLKRGDKVVMHTCKAAKENPGRIWEVEKDEYLNVLNKHNVVLLRGYLKPFKVRYLQKLDFPTSNRVPTLDQIMEWALPEEIDNHNILNNLSQMSVEERFTEVQRAIEHFLVYPPTHETHEADISYFDGKLNLTIPVPSDFRINYDREHTAVLKKIHNLLTEIGIMNTVTLLMYVHDIAEILENCLEHNLKCTKLEPVGVKYSAKGLDLIVKSY